MRVLGYSKKWDKLKKPEHTTFRFPRKDSAKGRDWHVGETVQEVFHPRGKDREFIQVAMIIKKEPRLICSIDDEEAVEDGFPEGFPQMMEFLNQPKGDAIINKLTLRVVDRF